MLGSAQTNINVFTPEDLQPGKPCDTLRYVITYDMAYVEDTLQVPMKAAHETMLLETGRKVQLSTATTPSEATQSMPDF